MAGATATFWAQLEASASEFVAQKQTAASGFRERFADLAQQLEAEAELLLKSADAPRPARPSDSNGHAGPSSPRGGDNQPSTSYSAHAHASAADRQQRRPALDAALERVSAICTAVDVDSYAWDVGINTIPSSQEGLVNRLNGLLSSEMYEEALRLYMQLEVPSLHWPSPDQSPGSGGTPRSPRDRTPPHVDPVRPLLTDSRVRGGGLMAVTGTNNLVLQAVRRQLQQWATRVLAQQHPDASLVLIHHQLLEHARGQKVPNRARSTWHRLQLPDRSELSSLLTHSVFHLSPSAEAAWSSLLRVLWHGLAVPTREAQESGGSSSPLPAPKRWTPNSFNRRINELEAAQQKLVTKMVASGSGAGSKGLMAAGEVEFGEYARVMLPRTYLQMVGQKLLFHAATQLPHLMALPERVPDHVIISLYTRPFAHALRMALETVFENPAIDPHAFVPEAKNSNAQRTYRSLLANNDAASPGPRTPAVSTPAVVAPAGAAAAQAAGAVASRAFLTVTQAIFRDVVSFERALAEIMDGGGQHKAPDHYKMLVRDDIDVVVRALRPHIGKLMIESMTTAVQALLSADRPDGPVQVEVLQDSWPAAEFLRVDFSNNDMVIRTISRRSVDLQFRIDAERPMYLDDTSYQVLSLVSGNLFRLQQYPELLQVYMAMAVLESLSLLMDHLATSCVPAHDLPPLSPQMLLLHHSAATCVRRRLESFRQPLDLAVQDEQYEAMVRMYANCLLQADELITSLQRHLLTALTDVTNNIIFWHVDTLEWTSFRRPLKRADAPCAAPRVWRLALLRLLHAASRITSLAFAEWLLSQVLQETLALIGLRYLLLSPSPQRLPQYVADVAHVTCTVITLCQQYTLPGQARALQQDTGDDADEDADGALTSGSGAAPAADAGSSSAAAAAAPSLGMRGTSASGSGAATAGGSSAGNGLGGAAASALAAARNSDAAARAAAAAVIQLPPKQLQVALGVAHRLAMACSALCTRAGLLTMDAKEFAALARSRVSSAVSAIGAAAAAGAAGPPAAAGAAAPPGGWQAGVPSPAAIQQALQAAAAAAAASGGGSAHLARPSLTEAGGDTLAPGAAAAAPEQQQQQQQQQGQASVQQPSEEQRQSQQQLQQTPMDQQQPRTSQGGARMDLAASSCSVITTSLTSLVVAVKAQEAAEAEVGLHGEPSMQQLQQQQQDGPQQDQEQLQLQQQQQSAHQPQEQQQGSPEAGVSTSAPASPPPEAPSLQEGGPVPVPRSGPSFYGPLPSLSGVHGVSGGDASAPALAPGGVRRPKGHLPALATAGGGSGSRAPSPVLAGGASGGAAAPLPELDIPAAGRPGASSSNGGGGDAADPASPPLPAPLVSPSGVQLPITPGAPGPVAEAIDTGASSSGVGGAGIGQQQQAPPPAAQGRPGLFGTSSLTISDSDGDLSVRRGGSRANASVTFQRGSWSVHGPTKSAMSKTNKSPGAAGFRRPTSANSTKRAHFASGDELEDSGSGPEDEDRLSPSGLMGVGGTRVRSGRSSARSSFSFTADADFMGIPDGSGSSLRCSGDGSGGAPGPRNMSEVWSWLPGQVLLDLLSRVPSLHHVFDPLEHLDPDDNPMDTSTTGVPWREAMGRLAREASREDVLDALRKRHELHPEVEGLPYSDEEREARRIIRELADELLTDQQ